MTVQRILLLQTISASRTFYSIVTNRLSIRTAKIDTRDPIGLRRPISLNNRILRLTNLSPTTNFTNIPIRQITSPSSQITINFRFLRSQERDLNSLTHARTNSRHRTPKSTFKIRHLHRFRNVLQHHNQARFSTSQVISRKNRLSIHQVRITNTLTRP